MLSFQQLLCIWTLYAVSASAEFCNTGSKTWDTSNQIIATPDDVKSFEECAEVCKALRECVGFTWFDLNPPERFTTLCVAFRALNDEYDCKSCESGMMQTHPHQCKSSEGNLFKIVHAQSYESCHDLCMVERDCKYFTFYTDENELIRRECLMYSSCQQVEPCQGGPSGCSTSSMECAGPCAALKYNVLDEADRNVQNHDTEGLRFYDRMNAEHHGDWKGTGWYRMKYPAGVMIPENSTAKYQCQTWASGWFNDKHPEQPGEEKEAQVCFSARVGPCHYKQNIKVRNCGRYFLYHLVEFVDDLNYRHCAE